MRVCLASLVYWGYIGIMENKLETTIYWGDIGVMENKWKLLYIGVI